MNCRWFRWATCMVALLPLAYVAGCAEKVTEKDVQAAKEKADAERMDVANARADAEKKIATESQQARVADTKLAETEAKAAATRDREQFVAQVEADLQAADRRVDELKTTASKQEGSAKEATDAKIKDIQSKQTLVKDSLDKVKSAELLQWQVHRPAVQQAADDLRRSMV